MRQRLLNGSSSFVSAKNILRLGFTMLLFSGFAATAQNSDIVPKAGYTAPANVAYGTYQAADVVADATSLEVAGFTVRDGGAGAPDGDSKPTIITDLTFSLSNSANIRRVALYASNQTTEIAEVAGSATPTFTGLTLTAADNGTLDFYVRVTFNSTVTDNQQYQFAVTNVSTDVPANSSSLSAFGTAVSSVASNDNKIIVAASKFRFVQGPSNTLAGVNMTPAVTVEAVDALNNRDLDFITAVSITSTGTLSGAQSVSFVAGLGTYSTISHSVVGTGLTLTATNGALTDAASGTFDITSSNTSDIVLDNTFTHPSNVAYNTFQEAANIQNSATSVIATRFKIQDGGGAADGDAVGTELTTLSLDLGSNWAYIRRIALYNSAGTAELAGTEQGVTGQTVNFTGLALTTTDGGSTSFSVRVSFTTNVVDNGQFTFTISSATAGNTSTFASLNAGGAASSSSSDDNRIEVTRTKLLFVQQPSDVISSVTMSPSPTVEAVDANNVRDLDFTSNVNITSDGTLNSTPKTSAAVAGVATFSTIVHTVASSSPRTLTAASSGLTSATSNTFNVTTSQLSSIIETPGFTYGSNVNYSSAANQEAANLTSVNSFLAAGFRIVDGDGISNDADNLGTTLTNLTLDLGTNWAFIRRIALYNGSTEVASSEKAVSGQTVTWTGLTLSAADFGTFDFRVRVSFNSVVTDNQQFSITVNSATASATTSGFAAANAGGAVSSTSGDINRIEVTRTKLLFVQDATSTNINDAMSPDPSAKATDALNNTDLDFTSNMTLTSDGTMSPTSITVAAVAGVATFSNVVHTAAANNINLHVASSGLTTIDGANFNILSLSQLSKIELNGSFTYPTNIAYTSNQETDLLDTSLDVVGLTLRDGDGTNDSDNKSTTLTSLTVAITNSAFLRKVALFDGTTELDEQTAGPTVVFSGFTLAAADNGTNNFTIKASFTNTGIVDNQQFSFTITAASSLGSGSGFALADAGGVSSLTTGDRNRIEVTASKFLFVQQPSNVGNGSIMSPSPTVEAVDANNFRDLDYIGTVGVTSTGTMTGSPQNAIFVAGLGTYNSIVHTVSQAGRQLSTNHGSFTNATSTTFDIGAASVSDIIANTIYAYPQNINYTLYQENANIDAVSGTSIEVAKFDVRDGGASSDGDSNPTVLTDVTLDLGATSGYIRRIALYDATGTIELGEQAVSGSTVAFSGLTISAADNGSASFTVRVSFTTAVADNQPFTIAINSATAQAGNSLFASANAGGAITSTALDNNKIEVVASKLRFVTQPANTVMNVAMSPSPSVEAVDVNNIRDLDNTVTINLTTSGTLSTSPTAILSSGLGTFSDVTHSASGTGVTLTTSNVAGLTEVVSNSFDVIAKLSDIITNTSFTYSSNINYASFQESTNLSNANSVAVAMFDIRDGGGTNDGDLYSTTLTDLTLDLGTNYSFIQRIALYDASGVNEIASTDKAVSTQTVAWTGLSISAADNGSQSFVVRVSFNSVVTDNQQISVTVNAASTGTTLTESRFAASNAGGAVTSTASDNNRIEVSATKFRFIQQPTSGTLAGVNMSPAVTVEATDALNNRDLDFATSVTVSSSAGTSVMPNQSAVFASGLGTYNAINHNATGSALTLTASNGVLTDGTSSLFNIGASATSDITVSPLYSYASNISYSSYQASDLTVANSIGVGSFLLRDGGSAFNDADGVGTRLTSITLNVGGIANLNRIALYQGNTEIAEQAATSPITFSSLSITAADNSSTAIEVRVSFKPAVTDNQQISFTVNAATASSATSTFAAGNAGGAVTPTTGDVNRIEVTATQLVYTTPPSSTVFVSVPFASAIVVKAEDGNLNVDLDYTSTATISNAENIKMTDGAGHNSVTNYTQAFAAGVLTFDSNFSYDSKGSGLTGNGTLTVTVPDLVPTGWASTSVTVQSSSTSDVIEGSFNETNNIVHLNYRTSAIDLVGGDEIQVGAFIVRDGGGSSDPDNAKSDLTSVTFEVENYSFIKQLALYVNTTELKEITINSSTVTPTTGTKGLVTFSGITVSAPDNNTGPVANRTILVYASFNDAVTDNQQISFSVNAVTWDQAYSTGATNGGGPASDLSEADDNKIEVTATQIDFTTIPATASINTPFTMVAKGVDAASSSVHNVDLDFTGTITVFTNTSNYTIANGPTLNTSAFTAGVFNFNPNFQFTSGSSTTKFDITAGGISSVLSQTPTITVISSFDSYVYNVQSATNINYISYTGSSINLTNASTGATDGAEVLYMYLQDGGWNFPDVDGAPTVLQDITFGIANPQSIQRIAIYTRNSSTGVWSETAEQPGSNISADTYGFITFSGVNITAADDENTQFKLVVTFNNTPSTIVDNSSIEVNIIGAVNGTGSKFRGDVSDVTYTPSSSYIGGFVKTLVTNALAPASTYQTNGAAVSTAHTIEVTATALEFTTQPIDGLNSAKVVGIKYTFPTAGVIEARDANDVKDLDYDATTGAAGFTYLTLTSPAAGLPANPYNVNFVQGVATIASPSSANLMYTSTGNGTLTATATKVGGGTINSSGQPCQNVEVVHTTFSAIPKGVGGLVSSESLRGGSLSKTIYGVTFTSQDATSTEPNLQSFIIRFSNTINGVFTNVKVYETTTPQFTTTTPVSVTVDGSGTFATVNVGSRPLTSSSPTRSYFLVVDVAKTASSSTPKIQPSVTDIVYDPTLSGNDVVMSKGSAYGTAVGLEYNFAATTPPALVSSYPAAGQRNIQINQDKVTLYFDRSVKSTNGLIMLWRQDSTTGTPVKVCDMVFTDTHPAEEYSQDLVFQIPGSTPGFPLINDKVYFVTVAKDVIIDENNNKFVGVEYSGTVYFRTTNNEPPAIVVDGKYDPVIIDNTQPRAAVLGAAFTEEGKGYYLVTLASDVTAPTVAQIKGGGHPGEVARDTFDITTTGQSITYFTVTGLSENKSYKVYVYAEGYTEQDGNPTVVPNAGYFGTSASGYLAQASPDGPTFNPVKTAAVGSLTSVILNQPVYSICANSEVTLTHPIMISEGVNSAFSGGAQHFFLVLPSGFEFTSKAGTIVCSGADFASTTGTLEHINNSILKVSFYNSGSSSYDVIAISGLTVKGSSATSLNITRIGGSGLSGVPDLAKLGEISTSEATAPEFTNTFSLQEFPEWDDDFGEDDDDTQFVNYIPYDFASAVELIPIRDGVDYGPSTFSGTNVSINKLSLDNVGSSFNVTMTHTDNNGCISERVQQYFIYNPYDLVKSADNALVDLPSAYTFDNREFPAPAVGQASDVIKLSYNRVDGYFLFDLELDIPNNVDAVINNDSTNWVDLIKNNWAIYDTDVLPGDEIYRDLNNGTPEYATLIEPKNFYLPHEKILNAAQSYPVAEPYSNFIDYYVNPATQKDSLELPYYTGGLLGQILLTAKYQNNTNSPYQIPVRIPINIYLPARPIVVAEDFSAIDADTAVFCKASGLIPISGWPQPVQDVSTGVFSLVDEQTGNTIDLSLLPDGAFTDNANGTASLDPTKLYSDPTLSGHVYHTIRIDYTYDLLASPGTVTASHYIRISPNPIPAFTFGNQCEDVPVPFVSAPLSGNPTMPDDPRYPTAEWRWNFGDLTSGFANQDTLAVGQDQHTFFNPGAYKVGLSVSNIFGCQSTSTLEQDLIISQTPVADFKMSGVSVNDLFQFDSEPSSVDVARGDNKDQYDWDFGDGTLLTTHDTPDGTLVTHSYATVSQPEVKLTVTSVKGCVAKDSVIVVVLPNVKPTQTSTYQTTFAADEGWVPWAIKGNAVTNVSWNFDATNGVWTTANATKYANEQSALHSIAFDLSDPTLTRPILIFVDSVYFGDENSGDGVVLEYSTDSLNIVDPTKKWTRLGDPQSGINWYNGANLAGKPGEQSQFDYGWTGEIPRGTSKQNLSSIPLARRGTVVFRFAYGSGRSALVNPGFILDELRLGNGTRAVLLESFTNTNSWVQSDYDQFAAFVDNKLGDEIVKIDYHVNFPNIDPFNTLNQSDPGARALYYNISAVPQVCLDGMIPQEVATGRYNQNFSSWGTTEFDKRVLDLSDATFSATTGYTIEDGEIVISGGFTPTSDLPANTILHVAVIEENIPVAGNNLTNVPSSASEFSYVLRKLLPSASGTKYTIPLPAGIEKTFGENGELRWSNPTLFSPTDDIAVVIFLQNEDTKVIYQSYLLRSVQDPGQVVGVNDPEFAINLYPNPTDKQFAIELAKPVSERTPLLMYDQLGHVVNETVLEKGESKKIINTTTLSAGVYLIKLNTPGGSVIKKLMVVHNH
jgi:hypothetical protein